MVREEVSVIDHLLEAEKNAMELVKDAQVQADEQLAKARQESDALFKSRYEKIICDLENQFAEKKQNVSEKCKAEIESYKTKLLESKKDKTSFNKFLDEVFFG